MRKRKTEEEKDRGREGVSKRKTLRRGGLGERKIEIGKA